jgi:hypothetical protein
MWILDTVIIIVLRPKNISNVYVYYLYILIIIFHLLTRGFYKTRVIIVLYYYSIIILRLHIRT